LGRIAAQHLTEVWGQTVVVDNKSGAGGNRGAEIVAKAPADGYTLLLGTVGTAVTNQYLYKNMPYDSVKSFAPVALFGEVANVLAVHPDVPVKTAMEYVELLQEAGSRKGELRLARDRRHRPPRDGVFPVTGRLQGRAHSLSRQLAGAEDLLAGHIPAPWTTCRPTSRIFRRARSAPWVSARPSAGSRRPRCRPSRAGLRGL